MTLSPLPPGSTIGIVGAGQLGRMLGVAAARLGFRTVTFGPEVSPPAAQIASEHISASYDDEDALRAFANQVDVATYEFENIPVKTVSFLRSIGTPVRPDERVLAVCQDRLEEKRYFAEAGVPTASYWAIDDVSALASAMDDVPGSAILKTRRFGYDGKGQVRLKSGDDPRAAFTACGNVPCVLEGFVDFDYEVSLIAVRSVSGEIGFFDISRNTHRDGILYQSHFPSGLPAEAVRDAQKIARAILEDLSYVGVLTIEFFWSQSGCLVANEMAPRVHNSGHWTVEACDTDQFEQHIRAVVGWPLGGVRRHSDGVMTNLIGYEANEWKELAGTSGLALTLYGKSDARAGRKMGHTVLLTMP
ncbi:MAG: 5-(carboxyamino)imidazole ribonucleotide synthase [Pseudomonadota bacterium]